MKHLNHFAAIAVLATAAACARACEPFACAVLDFDPAPGQFVNDPLYVDPALALGAPNGNGGSEPDNTSLVSLGGFGGSITLGFDHTVFDDPANPFGMDAIVFGNSYWVAGDSNRRWAEAGTIEISRDVNSNGLPDDPWYLIPGTHIANPVSQWSSVTWDDNVADPTYPPADANWLPPGASGVWSTYGYLLPGAVFNVLVLENPNGLQAEEEGVYGYADLSPTASLPDGAEADEFYTRPDDPFIAGITAGSAGGDAFDIAWAIDAATGAPAGLDGFDFVRITTGVDFIAGILGEISTEVDAVADVAEGSLGDGDGDGDIDADDLVLFAQCLAGPQVAVPPSPCRVMDMNQDGDVDLDDFAAFTQQWTGQQP